MNIKLISIFCIFFLTIYTVKADVIVQIDDGKKQVSSIIVSGIEYVAFKQLVSVFSDNAVQNVNINAGCDNFFVSFKTNDDFFLIQLNVPTLCKDNVQYVPLHSFISALSNQWNFKYDIVDKQIFIASNEKMNVFLEKKRNIEETTTNDLSNKVLNRIIDEQKVINDDENIVNGDTEENNHEIIIATPLKTKMLDAVEMESQKELEFLNKHKIKMEAETISIDPANRKYSIPDTLIKKKMEELKSND